MIRSLCRSYKITNTCSSALILRGPFFGTCGELKQKRNGLIWLRLEKAVKIDIAVLLKWIALGLDSEYPLIRGLYSTLCINGIRKNDIRLSGLSS